jgi:[ribosomal protein S5]-alanine N-acetyltransferase
MPSRRRPAGMPSGLPSPPVTASSPHEAEPLELRGPALVLRYPALADAPALLALASDPAVTRYFSWGPYSSVEEPEAYIASLPDRRESGELLDFLVVHRDEGPIGITGLSELARRDRHATVGSWFGHRWWGSGANLESKAMIAALAFRCLGLHRLTAWVHPRNGRSQVAFERVGFRREGVLAGWHRHGDVMHDVVAFGLTEPMWRRSALERVPVEIAGTAPPAFMVAPPTTEPAA